MPIFLIHLLHNIPIMQNKQFTKILFSIIITILSISSIAQNHKLTIKIPNIKKLEGIVEIGIYNDKEGFPDAGKQYKQYFFKLNSSTSLFELKNIPIGKYAIALYHDQNTDGKCNKNLIGIPKESYGFSQNFKPRFSAPNFEDCAFYLNSDTTITIKLLH